MAATRERRRQASRVRVHRQRRLAALAIVGMAVVIGVAVAGSGGRSPRGGHGSASGEAARPAPSVVPGGPLAPAWAGGLGALWAPQNLVGSQPGTAAAYANASGLAGPAGYVLIADRGNNRVLVVSPRGQVVFRYPTAADLAAGRRLFYNDDTFVEPGGQALIANEEDNHAIVQIGLADHQLQVLFGAPGQMGSDSTHLNTPDDAYTLPDGSFTVADAYNCRILFISAGRIVGQYGHSGVCRHEPPAYFGAVNDDYRDRVIVIDPRTNRIVWQYGHTDQPGTAPGYLNTPDGMDFLPLSVALAHQPVHRLVRRSLIRRR